MGLMLHKLPPRRNPPRRCDPRNLLGCRLFGAGLGLSVVKEIVEAQQGEVGFQEPPEGGTSFWFTLPLANGKERK